MSRAARSTRKELKTAEKHQTAVIAELFSSQNDYIAERMLRCQQDRFKRLPTEFPWRCRSAGCWHCRRTKVQRQWLALKDWIEDGTNPSDISLAFVNVKDIRKVSNDPIKAIRKVRKGFRDVRDRTAKVDYRWRSVSMAGLLSGEEDGYRVMILIQHKGLSRDDVWTVLEQRLPKITVCDPNGYEPSAIMTVEDAASLARNRRGLEPLRIVVTEQNIETDKVNQPMPVLF